MNTPQHPPSDAADSASAALSDTAASRPRSRLRRSLLIAAAGGGALLVGWSLMPARSRLGAPADFAVEGSGGGVALNGWVRLDTNGDVVVAMPRAEMGQGVSTALPMLLVDELDADWRRLRLAPAAPTAIYGNVAVLTSSLPLHPDDRGTVYRALSWMTSKFGRELGIQITGGSTSIRDAWEPMRLAGASARALLVAAAAARWGVGPEDCRTADGVVTASDGRQFGYGELVAEAARLAPPDQVRCKSPDAYRLIGHALPRIDVPEIVEGRRVYGIDVRLDGMLYACPRLCPEVDGRLRRFDAKAASKMRGVRQVFALEPINGAPAAVVVVADNWWRAKAAAAAVEVEWEAGSRIDSQQVDRSLRTALDEGDGISFHRRGDTERVLQSVARRIDAEYRAPYLAHAALEPINCTAQVRDGHVTVWASTQVHSLARFAAADAAGVGVAQVTIHVLPIGGGFGRRLETDMIAQAVRIAARTQGAPVKMLWTREDDTRHDVYRPAALARISVGLDTDGRLIALQAKSASTPITPRVLGRLKPWLGGPLPDKTTAEGLSDLPYEIPNQHAAHVGVDLPVPVGFWRSVGHSHNAFLSESIIDEAAALAGRDPLAYRRDMLANHPRHRAVLDLAAQKAGWGQPLPSGRARGIALHEAFGTIVAQVAEVSVQAGRIRVHRVTCAVDCGYVVHPDIVRQQMEGSVAFALSAALDGEITLSEGKVTQSNFSDYPVVRAADMPSVDVHLVLSREAPTGAGEPGVPPLAPAVANAVHALTGKRLRSLPLRLA